ncbi:cellulose biosynthesis protein BcsN [Hoeflea sp. Naph1]|uniref:cellulose biosynthesis protein BcsN n=1 Tax=Hoeflea sp. Naph1 TaxID=3388653 RepID=UPI0039900F4B
MNLMMPRSLAMMALALSVTGCATGEDSSMFTGSIKPVAPTLISDVSPEYAAAYLPRVAGRVESVRQSSKPDHIFQTVLYPNAGYGDGENKLSVSIAPPSSGTSYYQAPSRREIISEMRTELPGVAMQISTAIGQNLQGPFGYAIGQRATGGSCIFAWQTATDVSRTDKVGVGRLMRNRYAAKVRLRYCHPTMSEDGLVALMSAMRVREISASTVEMLRFAEGSGVAVQPSYAAVTVQARPKASPVKVTVKRVRKPVSEEVASPASNAPRILKPGELAGYAGAQAKSPVVNKASTEPDDMVSVPAIPMPGRIISLTDNSPIED